MENFMKSQLFQALFMTALLATMIHAATFVQQPSLVEADGQAVISFSVSEPTDVEVAVLDKSGKVVRHLAAGVLGGEAMPPEPLVSGLAQSLTWDGLDDYGKAIYTGPFQVRVRLGVKPQFEKRIHFKDPSMLPSSTFDIWHAGVGNTGWGPDTVVDTSEILSITAPVLFTDRGGTGTGVGLWDGGTPHMDMCVSKETDDIILQQGPWGKLPYLLCISGITGLKKKSWVEPQIGLSYGEPSMDWFGRFFLHDRGVGGGNTDIYRFTLGGAALNYSWGTNIIDMPKGTWIGVRQFDFCNDQYGNIFKGRYPDSITGVKEPLVVTKWDSVGTKIKDDLITVSTAIQGIRVDLKGNIFIGVKMKPVTDTVPKAIRPLLEGKFDEHYPYSQAAIADEAYASIVKFGPEGGSVAYDLTGPYYKLSYKNAKPYSVADPSKNRLTVNGAKWVHFGNSFIFSKTPQSDMTMCCCYNPRFDVDRFGRVIYPDIFNRDFHALDNNGNELFRVHNRDLFPSVNPGAIVNIQTTDRALYLGDHINNQIIVMTWKADEELTLPIEKTMVERLRPINEPLSVSSSPNPFSQFTTLAIRGEGNLTNANLVIYNISGQRVVDLTPTVRNGSALIRWNGTDALGQKVPNGFYCCKLTLGKKTVSRVMLLSK